MHVSFYPCLIFLLSSFSHWFCCVCASCWCFFCHTKAHHGWVHCSYFLLFYYQLVIFFISNAWLILWYSFKKIMMLLQWTLFININPQLVLLQRREKLHLYYRKRVWQVNNFLLFLIYRMLLLFCTPKISHFLIYRTMLLFCATI